MHKQYLSAFTKAPVLVVALFIALILPLVSLPEPTHASMTDTRTDAWNTDYNNAANWMTSNGGGVDVYSNGNTADLRDCSGNIVSTYAAACKRSVNGVVSGAENQCVELFNRLYLTKGWISSTWTGNGDELYNVSPLPTGFTEEDSTHTTFINPGDAITFSNVGSGHVVMVDSVSGSTVNVVSQNTQGVLWTVNWNASTHTLTQTYLGISYNVQGIIHRPNSGTTYPDGTYLHATDSGGIYVVAGGAPMYVSSWANVGGSHPYTDTTQSVINSMPTYPRNGTYIHAYTTGGVYDVAGGAAMHVTSWSNVGGSHPYTDVDAWVITNQLRQYPFDGTYLHAYTTGAIYVVAGGSAMYVSSWANVGGTHPTTDVDSWVIANQLLQYPLNGTYLHAYTTGGIYVVAGGAPLYVSSWTYVGGTHPDTDVDTWVLSNQLRAHPSDATYVQPYGNAAIYEAAGGAALSVSTWSDVGGPYPVTVIPTDSLPQFLSYPQDGTYVKGYQSGEEFEAMSSAVTRITTTPLPPAPSVDDWAIVNQLGGVE